MDNGPTLGDILNRALEESRVRLAAMPSRDTRSFEWSREDYHSEINKANIVLFDLYRDIEAGRILTVSALDEVKHRIKPLMDRFNGIIGTLDDRVGDE